MSTQLDEIKRIVKVCKECGDPFLSGAGYVLFFSSQDRRWDIRRAPRGTVGWHFTCALSVLKRRNAMPEQRELAIG